MKLNEAEMRMAYQIEGTDQNAVLNEVYMMGCYSQKQDVKDTAQSLLAKLSPLSDREYMDLIRKVQAEYRLPGKAQTIGEMRAEARQQSGAQKLSVHDIMALERFDPETRHMIIFDVLSHESPMGWKGEKMRLFLTETDYKKALENQENGFLKIRSHAKCFPEICAMTAMTESCKPHPNARKRRKQLFKTGALRFTVSLFTEKTPYRFFYTAVPFSFIEQVTVRPRASQCQHQHIIIDTVN